MEHGDPSRKERWLLIRWERVPGNAAFLAAACFHIAAASLILFSVRGDEVRLEPQKFEAVAVLVRDPRLVLHAPRAQGGSSSADRAVAIPGGSPMHHHRGRSTQSAASPASSASGQNAAGEALRAQAQKGTVALTRSLKFRGIYGFYPGHDYRLPAQTAGQLPVISPNEVPPRFEQIVTVEVTIDASGEVADARVVAGLVVPTIEQKLLSAIRQFKYKPATRDGSPIPSQMDIVVHIPS